MKNITFLLIFIFICLKVSAQEAEVNSDQTNKSGFYAGLSLTPALVIRPEFRFFSGGFWNFNLIKSSQAGYRFRSRIDIQAGVEYFTDQYTDPKNNLISTSPSGNDFKSTYDVSFYQIPLLVKIYLGNKENKLRWYIPLGFIYRSQQAKESIIDYSADGKILNTTNSQINEKFWFYHVGIGSKYQLTERINLFAETNGRYGLWHKDSESNWRRFENSGVNFGLTIGANYHF